MKQSKLFYLFRPFKTILWQTLLIVFILCTSYYILLEYLALKLAHVAEDSWLKKNKTATWFILRILAATRRISFLSASQDVLLSTLDLHDAAIPQVEFKVVCGLGCQTKIANFLFKTFLTSWTSSWIGSNLIQFLIWNNLFYLQVQRKDMIMGRYV